MSWEGDVFVLDSVRDPRSPMNPDPDFADLRRRPILQARSRLPDGTAQNMWLLTRYDDVRAFLAAPDTSNRLASLGGLQQPGFFVFADPPDHTRLRRLLTPEFTARRITALRPRVIEIVDGFLDDVARKDIAYVFPPITTGGVTMQPHYDANNEFSIRVTRR